MANYFVYGEETLLVNERVQNLCAQYDGEWAVEKLTSWNDARDKLFTQALFSQQRVFVMDYYLMEEAKPDPDRVAALLQGHDNVLILYCQGKPDKRKKIYKTLIKYSKRFEIASLRGGELQRWVMERAKLIGAKKIEPRAAGELIYLAGSDLLTLENELIKLSNYSPEINAETVRKLAVRNVQVGIFDLVDSVVQGNTGRALNIIEELMGSGAKPPYLLFMLARQYRLLFQVLFHRNKGYGSQQIQKLMPMHPFAFKKLWQQAGNLSLRQCAQSLHEIVEADYNYKTGFSQDIGLLQRLIIKLTKK